MNHLSCVADLFNLLDEDTGLYDEFSSHVELVIDKFNNSLDYLNNMEVEDILDRISDLSTLIKKYGSIEMCLEELQIKEKKMEDYINVSFKKKHLHKREKELLSLLEENSSLLRKYRQETLITLQSKINYYLKFLYLDNCNIFIQDCSFNSTGRDEIYFELDNVNLDTISSGEFNRLRLALLTSKTDFDLN